jgi:hypothetical protein
MEIDRAAKSTRSFFTALPVFCDCQEANWFLLPEAGSITLLESAVDVVDRRVVVQVERDLHRSL